MPACCLRASCSRVPSSALQIDVNILPDACGYNSCGNCLKVRVRMGRVVARLTSGLHLLVCASTVRDVSVRMVRHNCGPNAGQLSCSRARRYKIFFIVLGLVGLYFTRGLYTDREVTYVRRGKGLACDCCGFRT